MAILGVEAGPRARCDRIAPSAAIAALLTRPENALDYGSAKLAIDRLVDPSLDIPKAAADLDELAAAAQRLVGPEASHSARLGALRRVIYEPRPWNAERPFDYEHDDPLGEKVRNKLLPVYLSTRRGNCVSMPILFLILADRIGLEVALNRAPLHVFVRWRDESGVTLNLETTSGAHPARDAWYRQNLPMSDLALTTGLYMRSLGRREAVTLMTSTLVEHLLDEGHADEALAVADVALRYTPDDAYLLVKKATACAGVARQLEETYGSPTRMPLQPRFRHLTLLCENRASFARAEALGWTESG